MCKRLVSLAFAFAFVVVSGQAFAGPPAPAPSLSFDPSSQTIEVGQTATVDLFINGLQDNGSLTLLGAFDFDVTYDAAVLSPNLSSFAFGPFLGDSGIGEAVGGVDASTPGVVNLFEVSLLSSGELNTLQSGEGGSLLLATLMFDGISMGTSTLGFADVVLSDDFGNTIPNSNNVGGDVKVVPLPAAIWLFAGALGGLFAWGRRKRVA